MIQFWISVLGNYGFNRCRKSGQIVCAGDEKCPSNSAVFRLLSTVVLGAFIFTDPHAQNVFPAVQINADGDIDSLLHDLSFAADMVVDGIHENPHCADALQRSLLPFFAMGRILSVIRLTAVSDTSTPQISRM